MFPCEEEGQLKCILNSLKICSVQHLVSSYSGAKKALLLDVTYYFSDGVADIV